MKTRCFKEILYSLCLIFLWPTLSLADPWNWKNLREAIEDPVSVRLQQGRKELTPQEREEIRKFGFTGLELMSGVDLRNIPNPGFDNRFYWRFTKVDKHGIRRRETWMLAKVKYKDPFDLISPNSRHHPGDWESSYHATVVFPPAKERIKTLVTNYFKSRKNYKDEDLSIWLPDLRKTRRTVLSGSDKFLLSEITWDDRIFRKPWEEEHRILGKDTV